MYRKGINRLIGLAGITLAGAMSLNSDTFPERAAAATRYVSFLAAATAVFSVLLIVQSWRDKSHTEIKWIRAPRYFFSAVIGLLCYVPLLSLLGFFPASFLFMTVTAWLLGFRNPKFLLLGSGGTLLFIYLVFVRFLQVPVPTGLIGG